MVGKAKPSSPKSTKPLIKNSPKTAKKAPQKAPLVKGKSETDESGLEKFMDVVSPQWAKIRKMGKNGKS